MGSNTYDTLYKSSTNMMNRRGCKTEGTPQIRSTLDLFMGAASTNFFYKVSFWKKVWKWIDTTNFYALQTWFLKWKLWSTLSEAFDKSMKTLATCQNVYLFWLKEPYILLISSIRAWSLEWPYVKPSCIWKQKVIISQIIMPLIVHYSLHKFWFEVKV